MLVFWIFYKRLGIRCIGLDNIRPSYCLRELTGKAFYYYAHGITNDVTRCKAFLLVSNQLEHFCMIIPHIIVRETSERGVDCRTRQRANVDAMLAIAAAV